MGLKPEQQRCLGKGSGITPLASARALDKAHVQMVVLGALYGSWGEHHFPSRSPVRTDALLFYVERLKELRQQIQSASQPTSDTATATAFVTFRQAR